MLKKLVFILSGICFSNLYAIMINGTVTMPTQETGYIINTDSLVTSPSSQSAAIDVLIQKTSCTLTCPGTCNYAITGCNTIFKFKVPLDSIDFSIPLDTLNANIIERKDEGIQFSAQSLYGKESNPDISFLVKDCVGKYAVCQIVAIERKPDGSLLPGNCYGYEVFNITVNWTYQTNGSLIFSLPVHANSKVMNFSRNQAPVIQKTVVLSKNIKANAKIYDLHGRIIDNSMNKSQAAQGIFILYRR